MAGSLCQMADRRRDTRTLIVTPIWWLFVIFAAVGGLGTGTIDAGINTYVAQHHSAKMMQWLHPISIIRASILELNDAEMLQHVKDCDAVASCLGHNLTFKGLFGHPRRLVTDAVRRLCDAIKASKPEKSVKFVLMNTTGNRNRDLSEHISFAQHCVIGLLRLLLPPHVDNEQAADYLRSEIGQDDPDIEWVTVRPDGLSDESEVSEYEIHLSPTRSAIFNPGKTSRINVAHFMAELVTEHETWNSWKGQMPVIYNKPESNAD